MTEQPPIDDLSEGSRRFYAGLRVVVHRLFRVWHRIEVIGIEHVPQTGGFILAPGAHRSILDTPIVAAVSPRMLRYMGAEKYFDAPGLGWFLRSVGGFPVERGMADREALRLSEQILGAGEPLVIYPEATRGSGPLVGELKQGAAFLACRAGVPIVPVGMGGAERAMPIGARYLKPTKICLVVGEPIQPPVAADGGRVKRREVSELAVELQETLQRLFDEAQIRAGA